MVVSATRERKPISVVKEQHHMNESVRENMFPSSMSGCSWFACISNQRVSWKAVGLPGRSGRNTVLAQGDTIGLWYFSRATVLFIVWHHPKTACVPSCQKLRIHQQWLLLQMPLTTKRQVVVNVWAVPVIVCLLDTICRVNTFHKLTSAIDCRKRHIKVGFHHFFLCWEGFMITLIISATGLGRDAIPVVKRTCAANTLHPKGLPSGKMKDKRFLITKVSSNISVKQAPQNQSTFWKGSEKRTTSKKQSIWSQTHYFCYPLHHRASIQDLSMMLHKSILSLRFPVDRIYDWNHSWNSTSSGIEHMLIRQIVSRTPILYSRNNILSTPKTYIMRTISSWTLWLQNSHCLDGRLCRRMIGIWTIYICCFSLGTT